MFALNIESPMLRCVVNGQGEAAHNDRQLLLEKRSKLQKINALRSNFEVTNAKRSIDGSYVKINHFTCCLLSRKDVSLFLKGRFPNTYRLWSNNFSGAQQIDPQHT